MNYSIPGYDSWKLQNPEHYDREAADCECDGCFCEIDEMASEECGLCEDCQCDETEDTECSGCFYCLSSKEYDEAKANGTLR